MPSQSVEIVNEKGLHARASAAFAKLALTFPETKVTVSKDGVSASGSSIMDLMLLVGTQGSSIEITTDGHCADEALEALVALVSDKFGEPV